MDGEPPRFLRRPLDHAQASNDFVDFPVEELVTPELDIRGIVAQAGLSIAELPIPFGALAGLEAVFLADAHQDAVVGKLPERRIDRTAEFNIVGGKVVDDQIGEMALGRPDAGIRPRIPSQPADQEDQPADAARKRALGLVDPDDPLVDFAQQHTGIDHLGRERVEQFVSGDHRAERPGGQLAQGVMDDTQLRAQLAVGAGGVDLAETFLPESPTNRQQGIVVDKGRAVLGGLAETGPLELPRDLAAVLVEQRAQAVDGAGLLLEQNLAGDGLHIGIGEWDADREAIHQLLEEWHVGQRALPSADNHHAAVELLFNGFCDLRDEHGAFGGITDILLHFIQHDERARQPVGAAGGMRQRVLGRAQELLRADVGGLGRKLRPDRLPGFDLAGREGWVAGEDGAGERAAHIEIIEFAFETPTLRLDRGSHDIEVSLGVQPHAEPCLGVLRRQTGGTKQQPEDGEAHMVGAAAGQRTGRGHEAAGAPSGNIKLAQQCGQILGNRWNQAPRRRPVGEFGVAPKVAEHLQEVRLAAAEEAADPSAPLAGPAQIVEERADDPLDAVRILTLTDEGREFAAQLLRYLLVLPVGDARLALVDEGMRRGIPLEDILDLHP